MAMEQAQQMCWPCWPHRRQAASHRVDVVLDLVPGTRLWEAACRRWLWSRRSRCVGLAGLIAGKPPPTGLMLFWISCLAPDCGRQLCWRWLWSRRSRCVGLAGLIAGKPPPTGLMLFWISCLAPDCGRQLCWRWLWSRRSRCVGLAGLIAGKPPPTGLMSPRISCLAPDCGRRLAGDGYGADAADVLALPALSSDRRPEQSPPPTRQMCGSREAYGLYTRN